MENIITQIIFLYSSSPPPFCKHWNVFEVQLLNTKSAIVLAFAYPIAVDVMKFTYWRFVGFIYFLPEKPSLYLFYFFVNFFRNLEECYPVCGNSIKTSLTRTIFPGLDSVVAFQFDSLVLSLCDNGFQNDFFLEAAPTVAFRLLKGMEPIPHCNHLAQFWIISLDVFEAYKKLLA